MSQPETEQPLFTKTPDFLAWLTLAVNNFPRLHRHTLTRRLLDAALDFQEAILDANSRRGQARLEWLLAADAHLGVERAAVEARHHHGGGAERVVAQVVRHRPGVPGDPGEGLMAPRAG